ncbi:MAG TPA: CsgG/HfaB family protein, partial [Geminicoccaceae bacterium]|nr:CsgG/HfaB family protein [Geminicoccaceae bacterium]
MTGLLLAGCASGPPVVQEPIVGIESATRDELRELPPPAQKIAVAVYAFEDETGQFEFSDTVQTLSRAVTQGATSILIEALLEAGNGSWFTVVEREGIDNLLRERQIIRETRALYQGGGDLSRNYLPPLLFAGMLLEGGIIGYDTNTLTGGLGARLLGIGGSTKFRQDTVTVYLRAISTQSGEVLESVNVSKTIFSVGLSGDVFRFVSSDEILEIDAGVTTNEPEHFAVKQAIEKAVYALILAGARRERWAFADPAAGAVLLAEAFGEAPPRQTQASVPAPPEEIEDAAEAAPRHAAADTPDASSPAPAAEHRSSTQELADTAVFEHAANGARTASRHVTDTGAGAQAVADTGAAEHAGNAARAAPRHATETGAAPTTAEQALDILMRESARSATLRAGDHGPLPGASGDVVP